MVTWFGTPGADTRRGTDAADRLWGRAGNDALFGLGGDDFLYGEAGNDVLRGGSGSDRLYGEIYYPPPSGEVPSRRDPPGQNDSLYGEGGDDFLNGGLSDDLLNGGPGNDKLNGWTGSDRLYGGDGNDELDAGIEGDPNSPFTRTEKLYGGAGNDTLIGRNSNDILDGGEGDDNLQGGSGTDHLLGGAGNDLLNGGWWYGNVLEGGPGDDYYQVTYTSIEDVSSRVVELPGGGIDTVESRGDYIPSDGQDLPEVENFVVFNEFEYRDVVFSGNTHDNRIVIYGGVIAVHGLAGDDVIYGSNTQEWVNGGEGNDRLIGGAGADRITGGPGWDDYQFNRATDSSEIDGGQGIDRIDEFEAGLDDLVFSGSFDADTTLPGRQMLNFVGFIAASDYARRGQLACQTTAGGTTQVVANIDKDPFPEFKVLILGLANITDQDVLIY